MNLLSYKQMLLLSLLRKAKKNDDTSGKALHVLVKREGYKVGINSFYTMLRSMEEAGFLEVGQEGTRNVHYTTPKGEVEYKKVKEWWKANIK